IPCHNLTGLQESSKYYLAHSRVSNFGIFEFSWLNRARSEAERNNSGRALKQLAICSASHIQKSSPKLHNVVRKTIFSIINDFGANGTYF
ncbi:MAG: hypothetical protein JSV01_08425, partial [Desulfobacterales bacterium]